MTQLSWINQPRHRLLPPRFGLSVMLLVGMWLWLGRAHLVSAQEPNEAPIIGRSTSMYDASLGNLPDDQEFTFISAFGASTQTFSGTGTVLTTSQGGYAGYTNNGTILDRTTGYTLRFTVNLDSEVHTNPDRAGFSVIALSRDTQGIELGFWTTEIWAQAGGPEPNLFTHAEGAVFDTTTGLIPYELTLLNDSYSLAVTNTVVLSGSVRDYTAFSGLIDPYETPNLIFLGDDTSSAQARVRLAGVSVITNTAPVSRSVAANTELIIDDLGVLDIDAWGGDVRLALTVANGVLTATTAARDGLAAGNISGNGSQTLVMTGSTGAMNSTFAYTRGLVYRSNPGFHGPDPVTATLNDLGQTGTGGALADTRQFTITVLAADVAISKTSSASAVDPGDPLTYTLTFSNAGNSPAAGVTISDTIPLSLTGAGVISSGVTITQTWPGYVWQVQDLAPGQGGVITISGVVSNPPAAGFFTNTASITTTSGDGNTGNNEASAAVTVRDTSQRNAHIPVIRKD